MKNTFLSLFWLVLLCCPGFLFSQVDDTTAIEEEEDWSIYENVESVGVIKTYCSPKIFDLSPNRFVSVGYDFTGSGNLATSPVGSFKPDEEVNPVAESKFGYTGLRLNANIPVISLSSIVWQMGAGFNTAYFSVDKLSTDSINVDHNELADELNSGLTSMNINTTIFKPLNENSFVIGQFMAELNGNYQLSGANGPNFDNIRTSAALIWGKRPHDRLQWGVGIARTYRAGELNYIPLIMYNYTAENRKWGTEILFPARAAYRRKFNPRNILLAGYELEGTTYRLQRGFMQEPNLELRRSEIRLRLDYQRQLFGFIWVGFQGGVIINYNSSIDDLTSYNNKDFFRGFFGEQSFSMINSASPVPYFNISFSLVSL